MAPISEVRSASDLYGLPLEEFTPARNALAKRLRAAGEKDEAARVAKLRKPSTAAWAVNQLVRTQRKAISELFDAGEQMIGAQSRAVSGKGSADELRAAAQKQRESTDKLLKAARGLLNGEGHELAAGVQERVSETLRAAAIDPDSRAQVEDGCLTRELQLTGLAGLYAAAPASTSRKRAGRDDRAERQRQEEIEAADKWKRMAEDDLKRAQEELREADTELEAAQRTRRVAAEKVSGAKQALAEATRRLDQLQRGGR